MGVHAADKLRASSTTCATCSPSSFCARRRASICARRIGRGRRSTPRTRRCARTWPKLGTDRVVHATSRRYARSSTTAASSAAARRHIELRVTALAVPERALWYRAPVSGDERREAGAGRRRARARPDGDDQRRGAQQVRGRGGGVRRAHQRRAAALARRRRGQSAGARRVATRWCCRRSASRPSASCRRWPWRSSRRSRQRARAGSRMFDKAVGAGAEVRFAALLVSREGDANYPRTLHLKLFCDGGELTSMSTCVQKRVAIVEKDPEFRPAVWRALPALLGPSRDAAAVRGALGATHRARARARRARSAARWTASTSARATTRSARARRGTRRCSSACPCG